VHALPDTTAVATAKAVYSDTPAGALDGSDWLTLEVPGEPGQWWTVREIDWSVDRKPYPVGTVEIRNGSTNQILWRQFFTEAGLYNKTFEQGLISVGPGESLVIGLGCSDCKKNLGVVYK
jgi:hypothetical protein